MPLYLVTGGAGFIGSHVVNALISNDCKVRVVDNLSTGKLENLKECMNDIEFIQGDLSDYDTAKRVVEGVEYISHQAAIPSVPFSTEDPVAANNSMVTATVNLFKAAVESNTVRRIVQAASAAAYGNNPELPKREDMLPEPMSPYAVAKLTQEYYARAFYNVYGLEITSLRYFNVFGPKQDPKSPYSGVISIFMDMMLQGNNPVIFGDGLTSRDFIYVDDVAEANLRALSSKWTGASEVINIGFGEGTSLLELIEALNEALQKKMTPIFKEERTGDVKHSLADISKAKQILGFEPEFNLQSGIQKLCDWYKVNK